MTPYDENGFLSGRIESWVKEHQESHRDILDRAHELNRDCHRFLAGRSRDLGDQKQGVSCVLFARIVELYQAIIVVAKRGMTAPTRILWRSFIEASIHFFAIQKDPDYLDKYFDQFHIQRLKLVNKLLHSTSDELSTVRDAINDELVKEIEHLINENDAQRITIEEVARRAEVHDIYISVYDDLSRAVHTSVSDLDSHVRLNNTTEEIEGLIYGPSPKETAVAICLSGLMLVIALGDVSSLFGEDVKDLCNSHKEAFNALLPEHK